MSHQQPFPGAQPQNWQQYRPAGPQQQAPSFFPLQPPSIATDPSQPLLNPAAPTNGFAPCPPDSSNVQLNLWHQFASGNTPQAENTTSQPVPDTSTTNLQQPQPIFRAPTASNARSSTMVEKIARNLSEKEDGELSDMDGIQENYSPRPSKRTRLSRSPQSSSRPQPRREQRERQGYDGYRPGRLNDRFVRFPSPGIQRTSNTPGDNVQASLPSDSVPSSTIEPSPLQPTAAQTGSQHDVSYKRERAKRFLLAMHHSGYGYETLMKEGFDPDLLRGLYEEIGLSVPPRREYAGEKALNRAETGTKLGKADQQLPRELENPNAGPQKNMLSSKEASTRAPMPVPASPSDGIQRAMNEPIEASAGQELASSQPRISQKVTETGKTTVQAPSRLEYLARLNAAKTQKLPASKGSDPPASLPTSSAKPSQSNSSNVVQQPLKDKLIGNVVSAADDAGSKRKAELARLRAEALKSAKVTVTSQKEHEASQAEEQQRQHMPSVFTLPKAQQPRIDKPPEMSSTRQTEAAVPAKSKDGSQPATSPVSPSFNLIEDPMPTPSFRIPGLFMNPQPIEIPTRQKEPSPDLGALNYLADSHSDRAASPVESPAEQMPTTDKPKQTLQLSRKTTFGRSADEEINDECIIEASDEEAGNLKSELPQGQPDTLSSPAAIADKPVQSTTPKEPRKLQAHEQQLLEMKKQLELLEQKKKAKMLSSRTTTPQAGSGAFKRPDVAGTPMPTATPEVKGSVGASRNEVNESLNPDLPQDISASLPSKPLVEQPQTPDISFHAQETHTPKEQPSTESKRAKIQSDIAQYDARFTSTASQLERLKAQMQELELTMQREREGKRRLVEELESMGIDTEGIPDEALRETRDEAVAIKEAEAINGSTGGDTERNEKVLVTANETGSTKSSTPTASSEIKMNDPSTVVDESRQKVSDAPEVRRSDQSQSVASRQTTITTTASPESTADKMTKEVVEDKSEAMSVESSDADEAAQPQGKHDAGLAESNSEDMDMEDASGSEEGEIADEEVKDVCDDTSNLDNRREPMNQGEAEASNDSNDPEAGEIEEHSPPEGAINADAAGTVPQPDLSKDAAIASESQEKEILPINVDADSSDDSDSYEPPEGGVSVHQPHTQAADSDDEEYEPPELTAPIVARSEPPSKPRPISESQEADSERVRDLTNLDASPSANYNAADSEPEPVGEALPSNPIVLHGEAFQPYESPLKQFKDYRFHPQYSQPGFEHLRSLTYSHRIDPKREVCRFEASGGICNDPQCASQHFRAMHLEDDRILLELGFSNPGRTEKERSDYIEGLRNLLRRYREQNVSNAENIAPAILSYRREFISDPTRVLNL